nr:hypothetical protein [Tanacetum cinerariifolium]
MKKYFFHLDGLIRSKVSFHQALYLILELGETTARCTQDILRHRDSLDRFSKVSWVICHRGRGPLLMPMILRHFYHVTYHWQLDRWMMVKEIVSRLLDEEGKLEWWFEQDIDKEEEKFEGDEDGGEAGTDLVYTLEPDLVTTLEPDLVSNLEPDLVTTLEPDPVNTLEPDLVTTLEPDLVNTLEPDL